MSLELNVAQIAAYVNNQPSEASGNIGSSQSIADTKYTATNYPLLKDHNLPYNINNPRLGSLESFEPQNNNPKKLEGLEYFTKNSPKNIRKLLLLMSLSILFQFQ